MSDIIHCKGDYNNNSDNNKSSFFKTFVNDSTLK